MKKILIILTLLIGVFTNLKAQNLIGLSKSEVVSSIYNDNPNLKPEWGTNKYGAEYVYYIKPNKRSMIYYFNENGICYLYNAVYSYEEMNMVIETLNKTYTIYSDERWIDYNKTIDYLWRIQRDDEFFVVICEIYKIH